MWETKGPSTKKMLRGETGGEHRREEEEEKGKYRRERVREREAGAGGEVTTSSILHISRSECITDKTQDTPPLPDPLCF